MLIRLKLTLTKRITIMHLPKIKLQQHYVQYTISHANPTISLKIMFSQTSCINLKYN